MKVIEEYLRPVTNKGTVTIPVKIRRLLGVKPRGRVTFRIVAGRKVELLSPMTLESAFGSVPPRKRPENFKELRDVAMREHARKVVREMKSQ